MGLQTYHITEEIERQFNLLYLSMHRSKSKKGLMSSYKDDDFDYTRAFNIAILNIENNNTTYLFEQVKEEETISHLLYETGYEEEPISLSLPHPGYQKIGKKIIFNRSSSKIINNENIEKRNPSNKLIVCQLDKSKSVQRIWRFNKHGQNKTLITEIDFKTEWRVDVFNQKILTFKRLIHNVEFDIYSF